MEETTGQSRKGHLEADSKTTGALSTLNIKYVQKHKGPSGTNVCLAASQTQLAHSENSSLKHFTFVKVTF